jgi:meso-butanediol dehydrogenase/(S,S)-butanediol dehydrogenase/diacetyl reductase
MTRTIPAPLLGKVALVTGAGRGIGRGIARGLAGQGADLALVDIHADALAAVAHEIIEIGSKVTTFVADVSDRAAVFEAVDHAAGALGGFDIMVNNAGIALVAPIAELTPEQLSRLWAINVDGSPS